MVAGHVVYGTTLLLVLNRLHRGDRRSHDSGHDDRSSRYPHHDWVMVT
jgi:hypothetical protein